MIIVLLFICSGYKLKLIFDVNIIFPLLAKSGEIKMCILIKIFMLLVDFKINTTNFVIKIQINVV